MQKKKVYFNPVNLKYLCVLISEIIFKTEPSYLLPDVEL